MIINKQNKKGFTLIELLVTIAIMAMLMTMAISVGRHSIQKADFTAGLNQFVADVSYARQLAARENRYVAIDFNEEGTAYDMLVQRSLSRDPYDTSNYFKEKSEVKPLNGKVFVKGQMDFAVNAMGIIRPYPVKYTDNPISVTFNFVQEETGSGIMIAKKKITLFPAGGIKIE